MVEWLREVGMPADFINKLSRMFQDIKVFRLSSLLLFYKEIFSPTSLKHRSNIFPLQIEYSIRLY